MKKQLPLISFICASLMMNAQMQGPNSPSHATESAFGCLSCPGSDWSNPANAEANDAANTTSGLLAYPNVGPGTAYFSRYLYISKFGFTIPATATITGIVVEIKKSTSGISAGAGIKDSVVQLMMPVGTLVGQNKRSAAPWTGVSSYMTYGDSANTWLSSWTPSMINDTTFGVAVMAKNYAANMMTAQIDHVKMTVYYTATIGIDEISSQTSDISIYPNPSSSTVCVKNNYEPIESVMVYDVLGKVVISEEMKTNDVRLNIESLNKGIYFIKTKTAKGNSVVTEFMKE